MRPALSDGMLEISISHLRGPDTSLRWLLQAAPDTACCAGHSCNVSKDLAAAMHML